MYSRCCHIDISFSDIGHSSLFIEVTRKEAYKNASEVLKILAESQPIYGYAGMWEERKSRNGTFKDFGSSTLEWWVGRDVDKYVPGIYWLTLISKEMLQHLKIEPNTFSNTSFKVKNVEDNYFYFIQAYNEAEDWKENEELIDDFCAATRGFFSKKNIQEKLDNINDRNEYDTFMSEWS